MKHCMLLLSLLIAASLSFAQSGQSTNKATYKPAIFPDSNRAQLLQRSFDAVTEIYKEHAQKNHFPGMVYGIVADGKLIYSGATGVINLKTNIPATTKSLFRIASMTKSFTAMAILRLQEENKLNITEPASKYIAEMENFRYLTTDAAPVTIHNLLTMTAGFPEDNPWGDRQLEDTEAEFRKFLINGISFSSVPGQQFEYSNLGYAILGHIITRVSGMPYQEYITKNILQPLGMNNTRWEYSTVSSTLLAVGYRWEGEQWKEEPMLHDGVYGAMGGLITSIEDFSKYVNFHLSAYPQRNEPQRGPVRRSSVLEMHKPFMPQLYTDSKNAEGILCPIVNGYGFGLGIRQDCEGVTRISHSGGLPGFGSEYRFYPEYGIGIICFANRTYAGAPNARVFAEILSASGVKPRMLAVSDILNKRKSELMKVLPSWDEKLSAAIFAENFFLDQSRDHWIKSTDKIFSQSGKIQTVEDMTAENQLRGSFLMNGENGKIKVYFTLSPEADPKIQELNLEFLGKN